MKIDALDADTEHTTRELVVDREIGRQCRIDRDGRATVHAECPANTGNENEQRYAGIAYNIAETVDAVVARPRSAGLAVAGENVFFRLSRPRQQFNAFDNGPPD